MFSPQSWDLQNVSRALPVLLLQIYFSALTFIFLRKSESRPRGGAGGLRMCEVQSKDCFVLNPASKTLFFTGKGASAARGM